VEEQESGVETAQDFDSELSDVKPKENEEKNPSDDEEEEDDDENQLDNEMGEVDRDQEEVLDEDLWDDKEDEDLDEREGEGADVQSKEIQDELMAKDDNDRGDVDPQGEDSDEETEDPKLSDNDEPLSDHELGSEDEDNMDGDMVDIQDDEERNQADELNAEPDFELPEEMNLDPEDLDAEKEDMEDEQGSGDDGDEEMEDDEDGKENETDEIDEDAEEDKENEANPEDSKVQENVDENVDEEEMNTEETLNKDSYQNDYDEETKEEQIGVRDITGDDANVENEKQDIMEDNESTQQEEALSNAMQQTSESEGGWTDKRQPDGENENENEKPKQENPQFDPNPYRSLGDASKEWKDRVKMIQDAPPSAEDESAPPPPADDKANEDAQEYQFSKEENEEKQQDDKEELQALGLATEEQSQKVSLNEDKEDEEDEKEQAKEDDEVLLDAEEPEPPEEAPNVDQKEFPAISSRTVQSHGEDEDEEEEGTENTGSEKEESAAGAEEDPTEADSRHDQPHFDLTKLEEPEENLLDEQTEEQRKPLTPAEMQSLRQQLEENLNLWRQNSEEIELAQQLWSRYEELTQQPAQELCEQLRLILEPTLATKLRGDYRSGKRINMKKVIPYIASQFRKDKIWLRRTKPNKRHYQVLVAIDDSESMSLNSAGPLACEAMTMIARSLTQLEVGELGIIKFGETIDLVHPFDQPFTDSVGPQVISQFLFNQKGTNVLQLLNTTVKLLDQARQQTHSQTDHVQLVFVISDGRLSNKAGLGQWIRDAEKKRVLIVFIIIDSPNSKDSILQLETVSFSKKKIVRSLYMDDFPFPYYIILHDMNTLPDVLADTLRQWFELSQFS